MNEEESIYDEMNEILSHQDSWLEMEMGENLSHNIKQELEDIYFD